MGGALVDNVRHWCRHHWSRINAPCVASDVVAPETMVTLKALKEARSSTAGARKESPVDGGKGNGTGVNGSSKARRRASKAGKQQSKDNEEVEFFSEYGDATRYVLQEVIGKGSYGVVCSAVDTQTGEKVAIKKINDIFEHVSDATRILREIKLLRLLRHPDIVELKHIMLPPSPNDFKDIYVVFELMESDLHHVIKANHDLTPEHYQFFLYQLLRALKFIHTANVFHRDLKPKNVLANADCKLKVCDFGLARVAFNDAPVAIFWTDYVATRWYRAPELCGSFYSEYTPAVDIWSIGCIFAEVLLAKPLFPGKNVVHQLDLITDLLGTPPPETISKIRNEKARRYLASMPRKIPVAFAEKFPKADPLALQLLERLLAFDPKDRPTAEEALSHPYFKGLSRLEREPLAQPLSKLEFDFERQKISKEDVRELIYREILEYHPEMLNEYLCGRGSGRFMYPSTADRFKRNFSYLEDNYSNGTQSMPPGREHASLPRERVLDFRESANGESQNSHHRKGSISKASDGVQPKHSQEIAGNQNQEAKPAGNDAAGEVLHPRRLFKSASVNWAATTSVPCYAKRNPSMRSDVDILKRDNSSRERVKPHKKSHGFGFELTKRFLKAS